MSHFQVCVAIPAVRLEDCKFSECEIEAILDDILEPFCEEAESREYLSFEDRTISAREGYETDTVTAVRFPDGSIHKTTDGEFADRFLVRDGRVMEKINGDFIHALETENCVPFRILRHCPVSDVYTFEEYCEEFCDYTEDDGRWGYWHNPNARWDYFSIGGRFTGSFLVKAGLRESLPAVTMGCFDPHYQIVNGARKKDIEWQTMLESACTDYEAVYKKLQNAFQRGNTSDFGPLVSVREDGIYEWGDILYRKDESLDEFLRRKGVGPDDRYMLSSYAFVDQDGLWHSRGDMGWFGLSSNDKEERIWHDEIQGFLKQTNDEDFLVVLDCHI